MHPDLSKQQVQKNLQIVPYNLFQIQKKQRQQVEDSNLQASKVHQQLCGSVQERRKTRAKCRKSYKLIKILKSTF